MQRSHGKFAFFREHQTLSETIEALESATVKPNVHIFTHLIDSCAKLQDMASARKLHSFIIRNGIIHLLPQVSDHLIRMLSSFSLLQEANRVFDEVLHPSVYTWNAIITAHVNLGHGRKALLLYESMLEKGFIPDKFTYLCTLKSCTKLLDQCQGGSIHDSIIRSGLDSDVALMNSMIDFYAKCGKLEEASCVFSHMSTKSVVSWSALISGYASCEDAFHALELFTMMQTYEENQPHGMLFASIVKACSKEGALVEGWLIHDKIMRSGFDSNVFIGSTLIDMYAKCGDMVVAQRMFDRMPSRDLVAWSALISGYTASNMGVTALKSYACLLKEGIVPDKYLFSSVLKACHSIKGINAGMWIHNQIVRRGLEQNVVVGSALLTFYGACLCMEAACNVFYRLPERNILSWGGLITCLAQQGHDRFALFLFEKMQMEGIRPDKVIMVCMLQICSNLGSILNGFLIHQQIVHQNLDLDRVIIKNLINMYIECGNLEDARKFYSRLPNRDVEIWTSIMQGYCKMDQSSVAMELFDSLQQDDMIIVDRVLFLCLLKACGKTGSTDKGRQLHVQIVGIGLDLDLAIGSILVGMYSDCGMLGEAWEVFKNITSPDVIAWGAMLAGYVKHRNEYLALELYEKLVHSDVIPDKPIFSYMLRACGQMKAVEEGHMLYDQMIRNGLMCDSVLENTIMDMYAKCECLKEAHRVFDQKMIHDVVSWATIIMAYVQTGQGLCGLKLFERMQQGDIKADAVVHSCILKACGSVNDLENGMMLHYEILRCGWELNGLVGSALICMYAKCGQFHDAQRVFDKLESPDEVSWGVMIAACAKHGHEDCALTLYEAMKEYHLLPTESTLLWVLKACGDKGVFKQGQMLHCHIVKCGLDSDMCIVNSILDMYAKCGSIEESFHLFDRMLSRDVMSWGIMMAAALLNDNHRELFKKLVDQKQLEGFDADDAILTSLLGACRQIGLIEDGLNCFKFMYNIAPSVEQYGCLADLLGRVGCLEMAADVIQTMPVEEDVLMWTALLNSCKTYGNKDLANLCLQHILRLDPDDTSGYVLLTSMHSDSEILKDKLHYSAWRDNVIFKKRNCLSQHDMPLHCLGQQDGCEKLKAESFMPVQSVRDEINDLSNKIANHYNKDSYAQPCRISVWSCKDQKMCFHNLLNFQECTHVCTCLLSSLKTVAIYIFSIVGGVACLVTFSFYVLALCGHGLAHPVI